MKFGYPLGPARKSCSATPTLIFLHTEASIMAPVAAARAVRLGGLGKGLPGQLGDTWAPRGGGPPFCPRGPGPTQLVLASPPGAGLRMAAGTPPPPLKRVLAVPDVVLFTVVAVFSVRNVATAAKMGPGVVGLWL